MRRYCLALLCAPLLAALTGGRAHAQAGTAVVRAMVEYIAGADLYLAAGEDQGITAGDTLLARRGGNARTAKLRVISSVSGRAVVTFAGPPFAITRGDTLLIERARPRAAPPPAAQQSAAAAGDASKVNTASSHTTDARAAHDTASASGAPGTPAVLAPHAAKQQGLRRVPSPMRLDGTIAIDFDALDSETRWGAAPEERSARRFMTPALRLYATASQLPGGMRLNTNLRYEYRLTEGVAAVEQTSPLRVYQASLEKSFTHLPLQFQLGRFYNPVNVYGGYWDGGMMRAGGRGFGLGVASGFEPDQVNGGVDTRSTKYSVFSDWTVRRHSTSYQGGLSLHRERDTNGSEARYISGSERLRLGRAMFLQRIRVDAGPGWSGWSLTQLDLDALTPLFAKLLARAHYARRSFDWNPLEPDTTRPHNARRGLGLIWSGALVDLSVDASLTDWSDGQNARSLSGSLSLQRLPLASLSLGLSGSQWESESENSWYLSPWIGRSYGRTNTTVSWQHYRAVTSTESSYEAASMTLSFPLPGGLYTSLRAQTQWGASSSSNRIVTSIWKPF